MEEPRLPPPPSDKVETYVVHVPRDQIYWVPPPEHAMIAEQRRKPEKTKKNHGCCKRVACFFFVLLVLGFIACIIALILNLVFRPVHPSFSVDRFAVVKSQKSRDLSFHITLRAQNPTSNMRVHYMQSDVVSISYMNKNLGRGKFPETSQTASGSDTVRLNLDGSKNAVLPEPKDSKQPVKLVLTADLKAQYMVGPFKRNRGVTVTCHMKLKGLDTDKIQIVSQNCETEFISNK